MTYFVQQYGTVFFILSRVKGYNKNLMFRGTQISEQEYKTLYYSNNKREIKNGAKCSRGSFEEIKIVGNSNILLGREVSTIV